jgi:hypothetical protein
MPLCAQWASLQRIHRSMIRFKKNSSISSPAIGELSKKFVRPLLYKFVVSSRMFYKYMGWRRSKLKLSYVKKFGDTVRFGPLAGTRLRVEWSELPKFLGTYEAQLHPYLYQVISHPYDLILNIGCAEGYYAVGLARAIPHSDVRAYDTDPVQRARCKDNVILNDLLSRISIGDEFEGQMFGDFPEKRVLVVCDVEGHEVSLLDPRKHFGLETIDLIVELHEDACTTIRDLFQERFANTHRIVHVARQLFGDLGQIESLFDSEMDQLAAIYENRFGRTSWLVLMSNRWIADEQPSKERITDSLGNQRVHSTVERDVVLGEDAGSS